jgi:anti-anti-sigma factor
MTTNLDLNHNEKTLTLRVAGDLTSTNAEALRNEVKPMLEITKDAARTWDTFKVDLTAAKMIDSMGLNLVVGWYKRVQGLDAKMQVAYSSPNILRTFVFTRLDKHIELVKV